VSAALLPVEVQLRARTANWAERAKMTAVTSDRDYQLAAEYLQDIKALRAEIAAACDPVIRAAHLAHKAATAQKAELERELVEADRLIRQKLSGYIAEQHRIAAAQKAAAAAEARAAQEAAEREAKALEQVGETALAELERAEAAVPVAAPTAHTVAAAGVSSREKWDAEVTDLPAFLRAIVAGEIPQGAVLVNEALLRKMAGALKEELKWPGVTVRRGASLVVR
jgi:hypothetical protein